MKVKYSINYQLSAARLEEKYEAAKSHAACSSHQHWLEFYYATGEEIVRIQDRVGQNDKHLSAFSRQLQKYFPDAKENMFDLCNLKKRKTFYLAYRDLLDPFVWSAILVLKWQHHIGHLCRIIDPDERYFYLRKSVENDWSCGTLCREIKNDHYGRLGSMPSNFLDTLSSELGDMAQSVFKNTYLFPFIKAKKGKAITEKIVEDGLIDNIESFLEELGPGFAFKRRQCRVRLGDKGYVCDLVFYHTELQCHVIIDIKVGEFRSEYIGKMNSYLDAADATLKGKRDKNAIGILLCMSANPHVVDKALESSNHAIGVAVYTIG